MRIRNIIIGGITVALVAVLYNFAIFEILEVFPELSFGFEKYAIGGMSFYLILFLKDFFVGVILMILFSLAYSNITHDTGEMIFTYRAVFYFVLYGIFALVSFTIGDLLLMKTSEGMLLLLTLNGVVESFIATIPIRIFAGKK
ncbi:MAG: hypothetical protein ABID64_04085 [Nitrospirota bacterium]